MLIRFSTSIPALRVLLFLLLSICSIGVSAQGSSKKEVKKEITSNKDVKKEGSSKKEVKKATTPKKVEKSSTIAEAKNPPSVKTKEKQSEKAQKGAKDAKEKTGLKKSEATETNSNKNSISGKAIKAKVEELGNSKHLKYANWGFSLKELKSGEVVYETKGHQKLATASVMKLIATTVALDVLGKDFTYKTQIGYTGNISSGGQLNGNILVKASGDPSLGSEKNGGDSPTKIISDIVSAVKQQGIKEVENLEADCSLWYPSVPNGYTWEDIGNYFGVQIAPLNWRDNQIKLSFSTGGTGSKTKLIKQDPEFPGIEFENLVTAGAEGSGDKAFVYGAPFQLKGRRISGTLPPNKNSYIVKGAHPDPSLQFLLDLQNGLESEGIKVKGKSLVSYSRVNSSSFNHLITIESKPLSFLVKQTNTFSLNLYSEALALTTAGKRGDFSYSDFEKVAKKTLEGIGCNTNEIEIADGCGLSATNAASVSFLTNFLIGIRSKPYYDEVKNSLAVLGVSGTLKDLGSSKDAIGKISAKTGTLTGVINYVGIAKGKSGKEYAFSFMANRYNGGYFEFRKQMINILESLAELP